MNTFPSLQSILYQITPIFKMEIETSFMEEQILSQIQTIHALLHTVYPMDSTKKSKRITFPGWILKLPYRNHTKNRKLNMKANIFITYKKAILSKVIIILFDVFLM